MTPLPTGTVTLLFADVEGSTCLLHRLGDRYVALLETFRETVGRAVERHGGTVVNVRGEELFAAFPGARSALAAAAAIQEATARPLRPETPSLRIRIGLHTGEPAVAGTHYVGIDVGRRDHGRLHREALRPAVARRRAQAAGLRPRPEVPGAVADQTVRGVTIDGRDYPVAPPRPRSSCEAWSTARRTCVHHSSSTG